MGLTDGDILEHFCPCIDMGELSAWIDGEGCLKVMNDHGYSDEAKEQVNELMSVLYGECAVFGPALWCFDVNGNDIPFTKQEADEILSMFTRVYGRIKSGEIPVPEIKEPRIEIISF